MRLPRHPRHPDPAFETAVVTGFIVQPNATTNIEYYEYCKSNMRPFVAVWYWPVPTVRLNMGTADWSLDWKAVERIRRLLRAAENRCRRLAEGPRIVEAEGVPMERAREIAFRVFEYAYEAKPPEPAP